MVLTGRAALEASGSVSAEDEAAIGGFERVMGPNGEAQYYARNLAEAYAHPLPALPLYLRRAGRERAAPALDDGTRTIADVTDTPARSEATRPTSRRSVRSSTRRSNPERKRPFSDARADGRAVVDEDGGHLERWRAWRAPRPPSSGMRSLGGHPVCLIGIESRNLARGGDRPRRRPVLLDRRDALPPLVEEGRARAQRRQRKPPGRGPGESLGLRRLTGVHAQAPARVRRRDRPGGGELPRAARLPGGVALPRRRLRGASRGQLNPELRAAAVEGSFASVIGGGPAAAVVFAREARARAAREPRIVELRRQAQAFARAPRPATRYDAAYQEVLLEKQAELAAEFDAIHTVERAREVGSLESIIEPEAIRPYLIGLLREEGD